MSFLHLRPTEHISFSGRGSAAGVHSISMADCRL
jgi:hypothetical protein